MEKDSAKRYRLPDGWTSKEDIAEQMGCSEDRVRLNLAPAIKDGTVESGLFPVWDDVAKRVNRVTAYREIPATGQVPKRSHAKKPTPAPE